MKHLNPQPTFLRAFSTGRECFQMLPELGPLIDGIALNKRWQERFIEHLSKGAQAKRKRYDIKNQLRAGKESRGGRRGHDIVLIIRLILLESILRKDYREMAGLLIDSRAVRGFLEIEGMLIKDLPKFQTIAEWVRTLPEKFLEEVNEHLVMKEGGEKLGMELEKWRSDATVVESNIHYPTDSGLMRDGLRWMHRWINRMRKELGIRNRMDTKGLTYEFGHRIYLEILKFKGRGRKHERNRKKQYRKLIKRTNRIMKHFERHVEKGRAGGFFSGAGMTELERVVSYAKYAEMLKEWERLKPLIEQVIEQARRRVLNKESIPSGDKLLSLWEEHSRVIMRGKAGKPVEFGHKVTLWESEEGMMVCGGIYEKGNPRESQVLEEELKGLREKGYQFKDVSLDRGYFHKKRLERIEKEQGRLILYCPKKGKKNKEEDRHEKTKKFQEMQRFRAGIEGSISVLVRRHALRRARLKRWEGFGRHVQMCLIGMNLLRILDYKKAKEFTQTQRLAA